MDLNDQISKSGVGQLVYAQGGLKKIAIDVPAAKGEIYFHGAHATHFQPRGHKPVLFVSKDSNFAADKPIRGGVPICFPWFGPKADDKSAPMHGLARISPWSLKSIERIDDTAHVVMGFTAGDSTRKYWPHEYSAQFSVRFGKQLEMQLDVSNTGQTAFTYQEALHTYLAVGDVRQVSLTGLEGTKYFDKVAKDEKVEGAKPIRFVGETDRVYIDTQSTCVVDDPIYRRRISVDKSGSNATVVWNPWIDRAAAMADFGDDEWPGMLCVETANTSNCAITLAPGASHSIRAVVRVD